MSESIPEFVLPRILVVDDNKMYREAQAMQLTLAGFQVETASNGNEALEKLKNAPGEIDLILLDVNMPGMNGYQVCETLKSSPATQFIPIVMVTALEGDEEKIKAIDAGADDFVTKPFNSVLLLARVKSLLRIKHLHDQVEARNRLLRQTLRRYVSEDVADPERHLKLGGEMRSVCVLFADIRGFTRFAEQVDAQEVVKTLNYFFSKLTEAILQNRGTLDKYVGDEIMAFFGAPVAMDNAALGALRTALQMQMIFTQIIAPFDGHAVASLGLGIGLHFGPAAVGNIGSERLMNYTVIGDTVNTAHRLVEIANSGEILISEAVCEQTESYIQAQRLEPKRLPGKQTPVTVYRLEGLLEAAFDDELL